MLKKEPTEKAKNFGFYAAGTLCAAALLAAIGIGIGGFDPLKLMNGEEPALTETLPVDQQTEGIKMEEEETVIVEGEEEDAIVTIGGVKEEEPEADEPDTAVETVKEETKTVFAAPLAGTILTPFSNGELVKNETLNEWRTHDGVDLAAPANTPVKAAAAGTVTGVWEDPIWGMCVSIGHENGYETNYYGLKSRVETAEGAAVTVGEIIGYVGTTAGAELSLDPHLHFAVKQDDAWVDPVGLVIPNA